MDVEEMRRRLPAGGYAPFVLIAENEYVLDDDDDGPPLADDAAPCECGRAGKTCGPEDGCVNRTLAVECDPDECPAGARCENARLGRRAYADVVVRPAPGKGLGVFAASDIPAGALVAEYVGEVLGRAAFAERQAAYAARGQRHYYFMALSADRVIDATERGNIARFMNHSCAPNCAAQKWVVAGAPRIALFATRRIPAGEELCFDYRFERFSTAAQACLCGAPNCKSVIGQPPREKSAPHEDDLAFDDAAGAARLLVSRSAHAADVVRVLSALADSDDETLLPEFAAAHGVSVVSVVLGLHAGRTDVLEAAARVLSRVDVRTAAADEQARLRERLSRHVSALAGKDECAALASRVRAILDALGAASTGSEPAPPGSAPPGFTRASSAPTSARHTTDPGALSPAGYDLGSSGPASAGYVLGSSRHARTDGKRARDDTTHTAADSRTPSARADTYAPAAHRQAAADAAPSRRYADRSDSYARRPDDRHVSRPRDYSDSRRGDGPYGARREDAYSGSRRDDGHYGARRDDGHYGARREDGHYGARRDDGHYGAPREDRYSSAPREDRDRYSRAPREDRDRYSSARREDGYDRRRAEGYRDERRAQPDSRPADRPPARPREEAFTRPAAPVAPPPQAPRPPGAATEDERVQEIIARAKRTALQSLARDDASWDALEHRLAAQVRAVIEGVAARPEVRAQDAAPARLDDMAARAVRGIVDKEMRHLREVHTEPPARRAEELSAAKQAKIAAFFADYLRGHGFVL